MAFGFALDWTLLVLQIPFRGLSSWATLIMRASSRIGEAVARREQEDSGGVAPSLSGESSSLGPQPAVSTRHSTAYRGQGEPLSGVSRYLGSLSMLHTVISYLEL